MCILNNFTFYKSSPISNLKNVKFEIFSSWGKIVYLTTKNSIKKQNKTTTKI